MTGEIRRDVFVYLAGPMTPRDGHTIEENVAAGVRAFLACAAAGVPCYCPQLCGAFPSCWTTVPWDHWLALDFAVIDRCTHLVLLPRWETSAGAVAERDYAISRGLPVHTSVGDLMVSLVERDAYPYVRRGLPKTEPLS